jgi:hypothetical protein
VIDRLTHQGLFGQQHKLGLNLVEPPRCCGGPVTSDVFGNGQKVFFRTAKSINPWHALTLCLAIAVQPSLKLSLYGRHIERCDTVFRVCFVDFLPKIIVVDG